MRNYTTIDLLRFKQFASENEELKPIELIKQYNIEYPELSAKEKYDNLIKAIGLNESE